MKNPDYSAIIPIKIQNLVSYIIEKMDVDFYYAIKYLYSTALYGALANEETKLWHLSTEKLYELLVNEKDNNELVFPDFT